MREAADPSGGPVPILTYHSLDESGSVISVPPAVFRRQMLALRGWGYVGIHLSALLDGWEGKRSLPSRPVVLTFDDGFANVLDQAAKVLTEVGFRATVFAVADHCGGHNDWPSQPPGVIRLPLLSWQGLRELSAAGFEVGAHTLTHPPLTQLDNTAAEREIAISRRVLEDGLGQPVSTFAYPYGLAGLRERELAARHYRAACGARLRIARRDADRRELPRLDTYYYRHPALFQLIPGKLGALYLHLRALGRSGRAALEGWGMLTCTRPRIEGEPS
jgi:peptidoglycan/xylan/chitin deacetylase (PgdA/CDA1 family)